MTLKQKLLYHQIHPLKLATDIGCEPVSLYFFWQHKLVLDFATHFVPPIAASLILICYAAFETIKKSKAGAYLERHMTRTVEGIRFAGDIVVMVFGPCFHQLSLIVAGLAVVIIAWCSGWFGKMPES